MSENKSKSIFLVVDDTPEYMDVLSGILKNDYKIKAALDGEGALKIAAGKNQPFDPAGCHDA